MRNEPLYWFGLLCFALALFCAIMWRMSSVQVLGINAYIKPLKFALSIAIYSWTMGWLCWYLPSFNTHLFNWTIVVLLGLELGYIFWKAAQGQLSHFNVGDAFHAAMYSGMAIAASAVAAYTGYVALLFFTQSMPELEHHYLWAIRIGLIIFVIFSFEGFVMGARLAHTIGAPDGGEGIAFFNWSKKFGDARVAHFIGMHALQVLPLLSFYVLKNTKLVIFVGLLYAALAAFTLVQALQAKSFFGK